MQRRIYVQPKTNEKMAFHDDNLRQNAETLEITLETICRPVIIVLKFLGISINGYKLCLKDVAYAIYVFITSVLIWADAIRYLFSFTNLSLFSSGFMGMCVYAVAFIGNALFYPVFVVSFSRNLKFIFTTFEKYQCRYGLNFNKTSWKRKVKIAILCLVLLTLAFFGISILFTFTKQYTEGSLFETIFFPFNNLSTVSDYVATAFIYVLRFNIMVTFQGIFVIAIVIGNVIKREYSGIKKQISNLVEKNDQDWFITNLEMLRLQHEEATLLLQTGNTLLRHTTFYVYFNALPMLCFILYGLIYDSLTQEDFASMAFYLVFYVFFLLFMTVWGAGINEEAHSPKDRIYNIGLTSLPKKTLHQIQVFLSRLNGPPIGIDVYGLFVVDYSSILMLLGTLITYTVVVLQMKPSGTEDSSKQTGTNCSCS